MLLSPSASSPTAPAKILVVDDEAITLRLAHLLLRDEYEVLVARSVRDALFIVEQERPDLVLLDITMPEMDGIRGLALLKQQERMRDVPVIFVTAGTVPEAEKLCLEAGGVDYISKPFKPTVLLARVQRHLALSRHARVLRDLALTDPLTGIPNRRSFEEYLEREHRACRREQAPLGLVMADVDCFKAYNDHYGHQAGDSALCTVATILRNSINRPRDMVARYGGEELACILPRTNLQGTAMIAEQMRQVVDSAGLPHNASGVGDHITLSIGFASWVPGADESVTNLLAAADASLYEAKARGRNRVFSLPPPENVCKAL